MIQRNLKSIAFAAVIAAGLGAGNAMASDAGIVYKQAASDENSYCHIKYMAMTEQSLENGAPEFNPSDVVDMYGPCSFDPASPEEVRRQQAAMHRGQHDSGGDSGGSSD